MKMINYLSFNIDLINSVQSPSCFYFLCLLLLFLINIEKVQIVANIWNINYNVTFISF